MPLFDYRCDAEGCSHVEEHYVPNYESRHTAEQPCPVEGCDGMLRHTFGGRLVYRPTIERFLEIEFPGYQPPPQTSTAAGGGARKYPGFEGRWS